VLCWRFIIITRYVLYYLWLQRTSRVESVVGVFLLCWQTGTPSFIYEHGTTWHDTTWHDMNLALVTDIRNSVCFRSFAWQYRHPCHRHRRCCRHLCLFCLCSYFVYGWWVGGSLGSCLRLILLYVRVRDVMWCDVMWCGVGFRVELRINMDGRGDYEAVLRRLYLCLLFSFLYLIFSFVLLLFSFSFSAGTAPLSVSLSLSLSLSLQHCGA